MIGAILKSRLQNITRISLFLGAVCAGNGLYSAPVQLYSNQLTPVQEVDTFQNVILQGYSAPVDFNPVDGQNITFEQGVKLSASGKGQVVVAGLYPDFVGLKQKGVLRNLDTLWTRLSDRNFELGLRSMAQLNDDKEYFVPWMQATYFMVANKRALRYLPPGAQLNNLTYEQLEQWAKSIYEATGEPKLGFPAGSHGLMYRFLEGYLTPSFVGGLSKAFTGPESSAMWSYLHSLWQYVAPSSVVFSRMDQALLNGSIWIAWDHTARLIDAFVQEPSQFVAFPAPSGPTGRGYLRILVGLGEPKGTSGAEADGLITYLTSPRVQGLLLQRLGFLPAVYLSSAEPIPAALREFAHAASLQFDAPDGVPAKQPELSGSQSVQFNYLFLTAFSRIVLHDESIPAVLQESEPVLSQLLAPNPKSKAGQ